VSASEALKTAQAIGIMIGLDGDDLVLEASTPPPAAEKGGAIIPH